MLSNSCPVKCGQDLEVLFDASTESPAAWHPEYCNYTLLRSTGDCFCVYHSDRNRPWWVPLTPCIKQHFSSFLQHINNTTALFSHSLSQFHSVALILCLNLILFYFTYLAFPSTHPPHSLFLSHFSPPLFSLSLSVSQTLPIFLTPGVCCSTSVLITLNSLQSRSADRYCDSERLFSSRCDLTGVSTCAALAHVTAETFH